MEVPPTGGPPAFSERSYTRRMRGVVTATAFSLVLLVAAPLAGAGSRPAPAGTSMTASATPRVARAHGVRLSLTLHYEMQCGYPGAGPLVVIFPKALKLPKEFAAGAVTLAGKPVTAYVDGHLVTVTVRPHKGVLCDSMGRGSLTLVFTRTAKLTNPAHAGSFRFRASHAGRVFATRLSISPQS
jgi:hypothetical protein